MIFYRKIAVIKVVGIKEKFDLIIYASKSINNFSRYWQKKIFFALFLHVYEFGLAITIVGEK